jgi:hypothetical protein
MSSLNRLVLGCLALAGIMTVGVVSLRFLHGGQHSGKQSDDSHSQAQLDAISEKMDSIARALPDIQFAQASQAAAIGELRAALRDAKLQGTPASAPPASAVPPPGRIDTPETLKARAQLDDIIDRAAQAGVLGADEMHQMRPLMDRLSGDERLEVVRELSAQVNHGKIRVTDPHELPL